MVDLFGNEFKIDYSAKVKTSTKKSQTKSNKIDLGDDITINTKAIFGEEFSIKEIVKKATKTKKVETDPLKLLKSKKLTIEERLAIINTNVLKVLGKQKDNVLVIKNKEQLTDYINKCIAAGRIDVDTETNNSLDPVTCKIMGPCLYAPGLKQAYIPINHRNPETKERLSWQLTEQDIKEALETVLNYKKEHPEYLIIMHNGKFDYEVIKCTCGVEMVPDWDTMIAARLLNENEHASLKEQYIKYIDPTQSKYDIEKLFVNVAYADVDPDIFALYAATDSMMTDKLYERQKPLMDLELPHTDEHGRLVHGLKWVFENIEMPIVVVTAEMELAGVNIDTEFGARLKEKYTKLLNALDSSINNELDSLKPVIKQWKLLPEANAKVRAFAPAKSKASPEKLEAMYPLVDEETGLRYKLGKPASELINEDDINLSSPVQLAILFYDICRCEKVNEKKPRATGKSELEKLADVYKEYLGVEIEIDDSDIEELEEELEDDEDKTNPADIIDVAREKFDATLDGTHGAAARLCTAILKRRGLTKLITTYIDTIPTLVKHWPDGRIRFHLNSLGTDTGRYSSGGKLAFMENDERVEVSGINIQNIPSHNKEIRMLFCAKPGYKIIGSDYSAQEPRLTTFISKDPTMYEAYEQNKDLYAMIAQAAFDNEYWENLEFYPEGTELELDGNKVIAGKKTHLNKAGKERRSVGKVLLLAACYGMSAGTAAVRLNKSKEEGQQLLDSFFGKYKQVKAAIDYSKKSLKDKGYVEDWAGRKRHLDDIYLPKYEVKLKNQSVTELNFNPFIICQNRDYKDAKITKWEAAVETAISNSQIYQRDMAAKAGRAWTSNGEMSNAKFKKLAAEAIKDGVIIQANTGRIAQAERQCFNARIQGGAASLTKLAMINIYNDPQMRAWNAHLIITVHDEVLVECPEEYADLVEKRLPEIMVDAAKQAGIDVPMKCDPYNVTRWYCDEAAVSIQEEFKKLEKGDEKKGILPLSRDEALAKVYANHEEIPQEALLKTIETGCDLNF